MNFVTAYHTHPGSAKSCGRKSYILYLVRGHIDNSFTLHRISYVSLYTHISKTRMHSSRIRAPPAIYYTGGSLSQGGLRPGGSLSRNLPPEGTWDQRQRPPLKEHGTRDRDTPEGTWDQAARQEVTSYRVSIPTVGRMTDVSKNSTLPQTSFADDKYIVLFLTKTFTENFKSLD